MVVALVVYLDRWVFFVCLFLLFFAYMCLSLILELLTVLFIIVAFRILALMLLSRSISPNICLCPSHLGSARAINGSPHKSRSSSGNHEQRTRHDLSSVKVLWCQGELPPITSWPIASLYRECLRVMSRSETP